MSIPLIAGLFWLIWVLPARAASLREALEQVSLEVLPTHTNYVFEGVGVRVKLTFLTPALPQDLDILVRSALYRYMGQL